MQYEVKESGYGVTITSAKFDVVITPEAPLNVAIGESARMEIPQAINYIKSGEAEIKAATDIGISRIGSTVTDGLNQYNANATAKTTAFNDNATNKTTAFNNNAAIKQAAVDALVDKAKQWAIGEPSEPTGYSAKYWANQAASTLSGLETRVTTIEGDIPAQASSTNQLADKNFVNSSIATNTANFIGTFNSVADLEAYSGQKDDNDYAFVVTTDSAGNTVYNRYKWNGTAWLFEYALNNSSFTANQWAAINSGATTANIGQIATKADDNAVVHLTGNETITGVKTFTKSMTTDNILPKGDITLGTSTNTWGKQLQFRDTTGKRIARIQPMAIDTTNNRVGMWVNNADNTVEKGIYVDSNGTTSAPTPSAGDNSTKIATTAFVKTTVSNTLSTLYPVGSIYIGTQSTCPLATLISGSTWELVSAGRVLQGADSGHSAGTTIEAGLPNISGSVVLHHANTYGTIAGAYGAFTPDTQVPNYSVGTGKSSIAYGSFNFSAGDSNSIYGNSTTVQPPAYVVNIWRRTA